MRIDGKGIRVEASRENATQAQSDSAVLAAIAAGDNKAIEVLYRRHNGEVLRYLVRLVGDVHRAEELVSDVFLTVWRQAGAFKGRSRVLTWVLAIARFKALSAVRRRRRSGLALQRDFAEPAARKDLETDDFEDSNDNPEDLLVKKETSAQMRICVAQLSGKQRQIIDLMYYQEKTIDEIAGLLGASKNTVKTRAYYARQQIARTFNQRAGLALIPFAKESMKRGSALGAPKFQPFAAAC